MSVLDSAVAAGCSNCPNSSDMHSPSLARWVRRGAAVFGVALLLSAGLKAISPAMATNYLAWTGAGPDLRHVLVDVVSAVEASVGALILLRPWPLACWLAGAVLAGTLLLGHVFAAGASHAGVCGCFGDLPVPAWATLGVLLFGGASCIACARLGSQVGSRRRPIVRLAAACALTLGTMLPLLMSTDDGVADIDRLPRLIESDPDDPPTLVIVGSSSCADCRQLIAQLGADPPNMRVVLMTRGSDQAVERWPAWIEQRVVPDMRWWSLIGESPPALFRVVSGRVEMVGTDAVRALLSGPRLPRRR